MTPALIGIGLALAVSSLASLVGSEKDRSFYPTLLVVVASYYVLFAVMGGSRRAIVVESIVAAAFSAAAILGFRRSLWLVAAGLAVHGLFDLVHGAVVANPGVPSWWPPFCLAYDLTAAAYLAWLLSWHAASAR